MPNKLGDYLASGRPVVTGRIGDLTDFLTDNVNAYPADRGNERDLADRMIAVLRDPNAPIRPAPPGRRCASLN